MESESNMAIKQTDYEVRKVSDTGARVLSVFDTFLDASNMADEVVQGAAPYFYLGQKVQIVRVTTYDDDTSDEFMFWQRGI